MPKISVIVPVFNVEKYLRRCIDSILRQSFTAFDLVLIDDGSTDNCGAICDEYIRKDNRVHVIHQKNQGLSIARNVGIEWAFANSNSEWITFIDSDDWIHIEYLKLLYDVAVKYNVSLSMCNCIRVSDFSCDEKISEVTVKEFSPEDFWCFRQYGSACTKLYKKTDFYDIRFPKGLLFEDKFVTYKLIFQQEKVVYIEAPLYYYFSREGSITKSVWTPKAIDELFGSKDQLSYFKKGGFKSAYDVTVKNYLPRLQYHYKEAQIQKKVYMKEYIVLKMLFKLNLIKFHKYFPLNDNIGLYRSAFPLIVKLYKKFTYVKLK